PDSEQLWGHSDKGQSEVFPYIPLNAPRFTRQPWLRQQSASTGVDHFRAGTRYYLRNAFSAGGSNGSVWSFPFCFNRISTFPSASSSCLRQVAESCMPSSNSVSDFSRGTSPFSSSWTIFSRRSRHSSNFTNPIAPTLYCNAVSGAKCPAKFHYLCNILGVGVSKLHRGCLKTTQKPAASAESLQNVDCGGIAAQGSADLGPLHPVADCPQHFAGDGHAFLASRLRSCHPGHPVQDFIGHGNPQLVLHELSAADTDQRPDSGHHGNAAVFDPFQEILQQTEVEHRLGHHVFRTGLHLVFEALDLFVQVRQSRIRTHPNDEAGAGADRVPAQV